MAVPDPEKEQQDFIIEQPVANDEEARQPAVVKPTPSKEALGEDDDFDLSDISHQEKSREDIISEAEAAAFAEE